MYSALFCKSNFSFLEGASHPEELVEQAHALGVRAIALTDLDGVYGVVRAHKRAKELGVHLIVGATVTAQEGQIILLAKTRAGYGNLCELLSKGRLRSVKGASQVTWREVCEYSEDLFALWDGCGPHGSLLKEAFSSSLFLRLERHLIASESHRELELRRLSERYEVPLVAANEVLYHQAHRRSLQDVLTCIRHRVSLQDRETRRSRMLSSISNRLKR